MTPNLFNKRSRDNLVGVHPLLCEWAIELRSRVPCIIYSGVRTLTEQRNMVDKGASKTMNSMHLVQPDGYGHALDIAPVPIDWDGLNKFYVVVGMGILIAEMLSLPITSGADWDSDLDLKDQTFNDLGHWEILRGSQ